MSGQKALSQDPRFVTVADLRREADNCDALRDPQIGPTLNNLLILWGRHPSAESLRSFNLLIQPWRERKELPGLPWAPSPIGDEMRGSLINFARSIPHNAEVGFGPADLAAGVLIAAGQQQGKSSLLLVILSAILGLIPAFGIDPKNRLRRLKSVYRDVVVAPIREWKANLFQPPQNMPLNAWLDVMAENFGESFGLLHLSQARLIELFNELRHSFEQAGNPLLPTFMDFVEFLKARKRGFGPRQEASDRLIGRMTALDSSLPNLTRISRGFSLDPFIDSKSIVIFETMGTGITNQRFFGKYLLAYVYYSFAYNPIPNTNLRGMVVIDEATRVLSNEFGTQTTSSFLSDIFLRHHEAGLALVNAVHATKKVLLDCVKGSAL